MPELILKGLDTFITDNEIKEAVFSAEKAFQMFSEKTGAGAEFTGFASLPRGYDKEELARIKAAAEKIRRQSKILVVIGIGGSYLGAAALERLFPNENGVKLLFAGCNLCSDELYELLEACRNEDFSVNIISKSGTTLEPSVAFRLFRNLLFEKYGTASAERIYCTTDKQRGTLHELAVKEGWERFTVPDDIGGRFSVLSSVGLLPAAAAGIDIDGLLLGAEAGMGEYLNPVFKENPAMQYAAIRNILLSKGKALELLVSYEASFAKMEEWWKQLFGESEGKEHKGLFPCSVTFTTDLHSLGQFIQDGSRNLFETVVWFKKSRHSVIVPKGEKSDGLCYLEGAELQSINEKAFRGAMKAHIEGGVPVVLIEIPEITPFEIGKLIYFFEIAVSVSGYMLGVNPFNQPGVESYKKNMYELLGKN